MENTQPDKKQLKQIREDYLNEVNGELNDEEQHLLSLLSRAIEEDDVDELDEDLYWVVRLENVN